MCLVELATSFPVKLQNLDPLPHHGKKFLISSLDELKAFGNGSIPASLLTDLSPPEYYKQHGGPQHDDVLAHIIAPLIKNNTGHRSKRSMPVSCPVTYTVNYAGDRIPSMLQKAVCNLQGTTCLSSTGRASCEEISIMITVFKILGLSPSTNKLYVRATREALPIACSCAA